MSVPSSLPAPAQNRTAAGFVGTADDLAAADILVAVGDYTSGASEDMFTLSSHGLVTGDYVWLLYKSDVGAATGVIGTGYRVKVLSSSTFQLTTRAKVVVENTADGTVVLLKGTAATSDALVQTVILNALIVANGDFTGGTTEDRFLPVIATGAHGLQDTQTLKLLYKAAAGVITGIATNTTVYAKSVTEDAFELAATSGGADIENTADGLAIFVKTS